MKLSLNLAQYYSNVDIKSAGVDSIVAAIGSQLGAVEEVIDIGQSYDGIVVVKVVQCKKHENADKLKICLIDDGGVVDAVERDERGLVQVVCGAPNVIEGMVVAWLPPGVIVPSTVNKDPFRLEAREIRGVVSNGMLASASELAISDNHDGLLEINVEEVGEDLIVPGTSFRKLFGLDDTIIDLENKMFTHRPDCFGVLGIARELAGIQGAKFISPEWYTKSVDIGGYSGTLELNTRVDIPGLVPRFMTVVLDKVQVAPSPIWMQATLTKLGIKPINNVVDITNYYSYLTGQPMHAYDYEKVKNLSSGTPVIEARLSMNGEKVLLLNGKTIELNDSTVVISTDKTVLGVGGVMGGKDTEVNFDTTKIILECANFDMYSIRRTSMKYGLFTDAVTRYTKGQSIYQCDRIINKAIDHLRRDCRAEIASEISDINQGLPTMEKVQTDVDFINSRLGTNLSVDQIVELLSNVEFDVDVEGEKITVDCPFWRTDVKIAEDVVEEIGRLYGYSKINSELPSKKIMPASHNSVIELKANIREALSSAGANEILTYSFVHADLLGVVGQQEEKSYKLSNALSPDLHYYRQSLIPSLLSKVHSNTKAGFDEFALFEIGKSHIKGLIDKDGLPIESNRLAFVFSSNDKISALKYEGSSFFMAKVYTDYLFARLGLDYKCVPDTESFDSEFNQASSLSFEKRRSAKIIDSFGSELGAIGEIKSSIKRILKLPNFTSGFEIDILKLLESKREIKYQVLSKYPKIDQDITISVDYKTSYDEISKNIYTLLDKLSIDHGYDTKICLIDLYRADRSDEKNYTFRISVNHPERTLLNSEVSKLVEGLSEGLASSLDAKRV